MDPDRWNRIKALYFAARGRPDDERGAFLTEACAGDTALLRDVQELLDQPPSTSHLFGLLGGPESSLIAGVARESQSVLTGQHVGVYRLESFLGAGSMGEVYRARDTKLGRDVAIKMLPGALIDDPDRRRRFEREARILASLNHQNIGAIYGLEDKGERQVLVLELVEGETLKDRLARGSLPVATALLYAHQVADALDAAHSKGIIHRDLKPANIKITPKGMTKVLDFGIAKVVTEEGGARPSERSLAGTVVGTRDGSIVGTAAYMSPEQAHGNPVDTRTDIWAFGCVLYEMLSGRQAFERDTFTDTVTAIDSTEPDWKRLPAATPPAARRLLRQCLDKDVTRRLADIREARTELDLLVAHQGTWRPKYFKTALLLSGVAAGVVLFYVSNRPTAVASPREFTQVTNFTDSTAAPSISPDGRLAAFIRGGDAFLSRGQIWVKALPDGESVQLTNDAVPKYAPVFTPDGSSITYTAVVTKGAAISYDTWTVPVRGGRPEPFLTNVSGLSWLAEGRILFAAIGTGIHMGIATASISGSERQDIYVPPHERSMAHYAYASPDRRWVLVVEMDQTHVLNQPCRLVPFDGRTLGRQVGPQGACTSAGWSPDGEWMYFGANVGGASHLWRQRFPEGGVEQLTFGPTEEEGVALAPDGRSLITALGMRRSSVWIREGDGQRVLTSEGYARLPRLSRDGSRIFYVMQQDASSPSAELLELDLRSKTTRSVLRGVALRDYDISRDETEIAYSSTAGDGESRIWLAPLDQSAAPREVARGGDQVSFGAGDELFYRALGKQTNSLARVNKDGTGWRQVTTASIIYKFGVSPDGQWVIVHAPIDGMTTELATQATQAVPVNGGTPLKICSPSCRASWSFDGRYLYLSRGYTTTSQVRTVVIPLAAGKSLPDLPAAGVRSVSEWAAVPGVLPITHDLIAPGPEPSIYAFTESDLHSNLYRIPIR